MTESMNAPMAWVTLATTDGYAVGALVLAHSLRNVNTNYKLHIMLTAGISPNLKTQLQQVFDDYTEVNVLDSNDAENLALIGRPDLGCTFTKLHCWRLTQYSKCVFMDADTFVVQNCDELFERPEFSAAPDIGWPDIFNTGVFVFVPSMATYHNLIQFAISHGSFDGGDQGLLNAYFSGWREMDASHRLPFTYNVTTAAIYSYAAALKKFAPQIKIIHFLGKQKPWLVHYEGSSEGVTFVSEYHQQWRDVYFQLVKEHLPPNLMVSSDYVYSQQPSSSSSTNYPFTLDNAVEEFQYQQRQNTYEFSIQNQQADIPSGTATQEEFFGLKKNNEEIVIIGMPIIEGSSTERKTMSRYEAWEAGIPDYLGADSFENIQEKMAKSLE